MEWRNLVAVLEVPELGVNLRCSRRQSSLSGWAGEVESERSQQFQCCKTEARLLTVMGSETIG